MPVSHKDSGVCLVYQFCLVCKWAVTQLWTGIDDQFEFLPASEQISCIPPKNGEALKALSSGKILSFFLGSCPAVVHQVWKGSL